MNERRRPSPELLKFFQGLASVRRLICKSVLGMDTCLHRHSDKLVLFKYHPISMAILMHVCYQDIYTESGSDSFKQLEQAIYQWLNWQQTADTQVVFADCVGGSVQAFELETEFLRLMLKYQMRCLQPFVAQSNERGVYELRAPSFPARLMGSSLLEHIRTQLLSVDSGDSTLQ